MSAVKKFIFQPGSTVCQVEQRTIRHAWATGTDIIIAPQSIGMWGASDHCPVGTVEFCRSWMAVHNIPEPAPVDYPPCLAQYFNRNIAIVPYGEIPTGKWIKPVTTKQWPAGIKTGNESIDDTELVWQSDAIPEDQWRGEWRVYVVDGRIVGYGRYDSNEDEIALDEHLVKTIVDTYTASGTAPVGYGLDVAVLANGTTVVVEVTDGWAIGYYRGTCTPTDYAILLALRWDEIVQSRQPNRPTYPS